MCLKEWKLFDIDGNVNVCHQIQTAGRLKQGIPIVIHSLALNILKTHKVAQVTQLIKELSRIIEPS
jgi:hypothetical protein